MAGKKDMNNVHTARKSLSVSLSEQLVPPKQDYEKCHYFRKTFLTESELSFFVSETNIISDVDPIFREILGTVGNLFASSVKDTHGTKKFNDEASRYVIENFFQSARGLAISLESRDPYTGGHSDRVFQVSKEIGKRCNLSPIQQLYLEGGSLLHDIGKIGIRDAVLLKPGPLTDAEYKEMQLHPIVGAKMIEKIGILSGCYDAVLYHHERIDGYGYPYGLKGSEIPLIARITSITDAYDAMTTNRVYRKALTHEQAIEEVMRNSGTQFDPEVTKVFLKWWEENFKQSNKGMEIYAGIQI